MNYHVFYETVKNVEIPKTLVLDTAYFWFHREHLPLKLVSLGAASNPVVKVPSTGLNSYVNIVPIRYISKKVFAGNRLITDIILPPSILECPEEAFSGCTNLKNITIPKTIKRILTKTFDGCTNLENVYYEGSREEWESIDIEYERVEIDFGGNLPGTPVRSVIDERRVPIPGNEALRKATVHFNCDLKLFEDEDTDDINNQNKTGMYEICQEG